MNHVASTEQSVAGCRHLHTFQQPFFAGFQDSRDVSGLVCTSADSACTDIFANLHQFYQPCFDVSLLGILDISAYRYFSPSFWTLSNLLKPVSLH